MSGPTLSTGAVPDTTRRDGAARTKEKLRALKGFEVRTAEPLANSDQNENKVAFRLNLSQFGDLGQEVHFFRRDLGRSMQSFSPAESVPSRENWLVGVGP